MKNEFPLMLMKYGQFWSTKSFNLLTYMETGYLCDGGGKIELNEQDVFHLRDVRDKGLHNLTKDQKKTLVKLYNTCTRAMSSGSDYILVWRSCK